MDTRTLLMGARALAVKEAGAIANTSIGAGVGAGLGGTLALLVSKKNLLRNTLMGAAGGAAAGGVAGNLPAAIKAAIKKKNTDAYKNSKGTIPDYLKRPADPVQGPRPGFNPDLTVHTNPRIQTAIQGAKLPKALYGGSRYPVKPDSLTEEAVQKVKVPLKK
jgi:hypothetical protein